MKPHSLVTNAASCLRVPSALALVGAFGLASSAHATDFTWGGGSLNWTNTSASGWNGGPPITSDTATINSGRVEVTAAITGTAAISIGAGGQFWLNYNSATIANNFTLNGTTTGGAIVSGDRPANNVNKLTGQITLNSTSNIASWWNDKTLELSGKITGAGGLTLDRATSIGSVDPNGGKFLISGSTNDYQGATIVNGKAGTGTQAQLWLGATNALPSTTALTLNQAFLYLNGNSQTLSGIGGSGTYSVRNGSATAGSLILNVATTSSFGGVMGGTGTNESNFSLTKTGAGDLVFNGGIDHTNVQAISTVVVNDGLVRTDNWGQWNSNLNLTVNGSGKFEMWNGSVSLANLSGNGTVQNTVNWNRGAPTLTVAAGSFSGSITDLGVTSGGFPMATPGLIWSNPARERSPSPARTATRARPPVNAGKLVINGNNSAATGTITVGAGTVGRYSGCDFGWQRTR